MPYAIYRTEKLKSVGSIRGSIAHSARSRTTPNADTEKTQENRQLIGFDGEIPLPDDFIAEWQKRTSQVKRKKDAVLCQELLLGVSPEFFGRIEDNQRRIEMVFEWAEASRRWLISEFGDLVMSATLHVDETTPHICAYVLPLQRSKSGEVWLSAKKVFNPRTLVEQQDKYAAAVEHLGLERGVRGSQASHQEVSRYYRQINDPVPEVEECRNVDFCRNLRLPEKGLLESSSEFRRRVDAYIQSETRTYRALAEKMEARVKKSHLDEPRYKAIEDTNKALSLKLDLAAKQLRSLTDELRDIPLRDVMQRLGYGEPSSEGPSLVWRTGEHVISVDGEKWYDHKAAKGGGKAIDLVCHLFRCGFSDAVGWLSGQWTPNQAIAAVRSAATLQVAQIPKRSFKDLWLYYAKPCAEAEPAIRKYLTETRHVDTELVDSLLKTAAIHGSRQTTVDGRCRTWCVFPHIRMDGSVAGASLRAVDGEEGGKRCIGDKTDSFFSVGPISGDMDGLAIVESPIDALSLHSLRRNLRVISMAGSTVPDAIIDIARRDSGEVLVALDDDDAGHHGWLRLCERVKAVGSDLARRLRRLLPRHLGRPTKDWNEFLAAIPGHTQTDTTASVRCFRKGVSPSR